MANLETNSNTYDNVEDLQLHLKEFNSNSQKLKIVQNINMYNSDTLFGALSFFGNVLVAPDSCFDSTKPVNETTVELRATRGKSTGVIENFSANIDLAHGKSVLNNELGPFDPIHSTYSVENFAGKIFSKVLPNKLQNPSAAMRILDLSNVFNRNNSLSFYESLMKYLDYTEGMSPIEIDSRATLFTINDINEELPNALFKAGLISSNSLLRVVSSASTIIKNAVNFNSFTTLGFTPTERDRYGILLRISESSVEFGLKFIVNESNTRCRLYDPGSNMIIFRY
jgi:hypothetical protein